ncbi:MAG: DUF58 domain-containing protein [Thermoplasmata archaeon]|nr:DUF58 domain-containing protein [Thermoplasmata archaeon]
MTAGPAIVRWRPTSFVLLAASVVLFAVGVLVRSPVPVLLAFPLLLAPITAPLFGPRGTPRVRVEGRTEGLGRSVEVTERLTPDPPVRPQDLEVVLPPPAGVGETGPPVTRVSGGALTVKLSWTVPDPVVAVVPNPEILWRDPLGLVERPVSLTPADLFVERYPPELHRVGAVRLRRTLALPGETRSRSVGESGEFFGIRDAEPGDPPRRINWRATARAGRRLANEYALDRTGDLVILLDARPSTLGAYADGRLLAISRAAAFGLAEAFLRDKSRVGIGVFGEFLEAVPLATGRTQRVRLRNLLLRTQLASLGGPAERCAVSLRRYFPSRTTTIVLSTLVGDDQLDLVSHVRRRGYPVVVLSPSPVPMVRTGWDLAVEDEELVQQFTRLRRRQQVGRAWRDAPVVDWEDYWSLGGFVDFLRRPLPRERAV